MRFLVNVIDDQTGTGTAEEMAAIDVFNERLLAEGRWILAWGIAAPSESTVIDGRGPEPVFTDGPLYASAEYVSGAWLINAADLAEARALAAEGSKACNRRVELRPLLGE